MADGDYERPDGRKRELAAFESRLRTWRAERAAEKADENLKSEKKGKTDA